MFYVEHLALRVPRRTPYLFSTLLFVKNMHLDAAVTPRAAVRGARPTARDPRRGRRNRRTGPTGPKRGPLGGTIAGYGAGVMTKATRATGHGPRYVLLGAGGAGRGPRVTGYSGHFTKHLNV